MLCAKNVIWRYRICKLHGFIKNYQFKKVVNSQSYTMSQRSNVKNRGCFIVFEGCDRCGKSTQSKLLVDYLKSQNVPVKHMAFPNRQSLSGVLINSYLTNKQDMNDESIHLLFALNRWEVQNEMKSLLSQGTTLVVDRYSYSGVAYSAAKGLNFDWCVAPDRGLIRPDLVFYLKMEIDTLKSRGNFGLERYETEDFQKKVSQLFQTIYETEREYWTEIDASQTVERIRECISVESIKLINSVEEKDIHLLWK